MPELPERYPYPEDRHPPRHGAIAISVNALLLLVATLMPNDTSQELESKNTKPSAVVSPDANTPQERIFPTTDMEATKIDPLSMQQEYNEQIRVEMEELERIKDAVQQELRGAISE